MNRHEPFDGTPEAAAAFLTNLSEHCPWVRRVEVEDKGPDVRESKSEEKQQYPINPRYKLILIYDPAKAHLGWFYEFCMQVGKYIVCPQAES